MSVRHVVIIGAARSGTKMLRDALAMASGVGKVPYDVGYVWRLGNEDHPDDVIGPEMLGDQSRQYIRDYVERYADGAPPAVIEKTVGNALRVATVAAVFPDARYIHLVRDGVDVAESARRQWSARPDIRYLLEKAKHFPLRMVPRYGAKYVRSLATRGFHDGRASTWGPRYPRMDEDLRREALLVVCARQWLHSVRSARADFARLGLPVVEVRYEELTSSPHVELSRVAQDSGLPLLPEGLEQASREITDARRGIGRGSLSEVEVAQLSLEVDDLLDELGYECLRPANSFHNRREE